MANTILLEGRTAGSAVENDAVSPRQAEPASFYVEADVVVHSSLHTSFPHSHSPISQNAETYKDTPGSINGRDIAWRVASHWGQCKLFLLRQPTCHRQIVNDNVTYFSHPKLVPTTRHNTAHLEQRQQRTICTRTCLFFFNSSRCPSASHCCGKCRNYPPSCGCWETRCQLGSSDARL